MAKVPVKTCPICGKPAVEKYRPFCSSRCADVDLNRWFTGSYIIPARDDEPVNDQAIPDADEDDNI
jgi:endogenous inhibitor of DNA gyrase (YacG/DUF329 family)